MPSDTIADTDTAVGTSTDSSSDAGSDAGAAAHEPRVLDTYSAVYASILLFLVPGVALMSRLPFGDDRSTTYTFQYVSLVTVPFILGLAAVFLTDSRDGLRRSLVRFAVLTPLVVVTGVTFMFTASLAMVPLSDLVGIKEQGLTTAWWIGFAAVSAPLVISTFRRLAGPKAPMDLLQLVVVLMALAAVVAVVLFSFFSDTSVYDLARKDVIIYLIGALSWYLPSFGFAAGLWRASGLV